MCRHAATEPFVPAQPPQPADFSTYKCGTVTEFTVPSFEGAKYNETLIKASAR